MKIKYQIATLFALLGVITACSSESTPTYSDLGSDTYPQKFYVEYVPCTGGPDYSPEAFVETMLPVWQEIQVEIDSTMFQSFGIAYEEPREEDMEGGFWQLVWNSKEDSQTTWENWNNYERAQNFLTDNENILLCEPERTFSFDAYMPRDPYAMGDWDLTNFSSEYQLCSYNEGKGVDDLMAAIDKFEDWLNSGLEYDEPYNYMILAPDYEAEFDYAWGNFHQTIEGRKEGDAEFQATAASLNQEFQDIASCDDIRAYGSGEIPLI